MSHVKVPCLALAVILALSCSVFGAAKDRSYVAGRYLLTLDGVKVGFVKSVEGGDVTAEVLQEPIGPDYIVHKHIGKPKYEDFEIQVGFNMGKPLYEWIRQSWTPNYRRMTGSITAMDFNYQPKSEQQFVAALITAATSLRWETIRMRDPCILADAASKTYYLIGSAGRSVRAYASTDLMTWQGPQTIFTPPQDIWGDIAVVGIWAPELHAYRGKYYLFLTFDTRHLLAEQWRNWLPRVTRGSQVLVADAPTGPFQPFQNRSTLPADMMTLDGTLWVEDGVPYMVFCHEWVQIKDGTVEYVRLKDDLSETIGEPTRLFDGSDAPWSRKSAQHGSHVTDAPFLHKGKTGKLYLIWAGFSQSGYTEGLAISASGKLAGPWTQQAEPLYTNDGGHGMLFTAFDGKLMMVLHAPNGRAARPHLFEMTDTGETLKIVKELAPTGP